MPSVVDMNEQEFRDYAMERGAQALEPFIGEALPMTPARAASMVGILQETYQVLRLETLGYSREEAEAICRGSGGTI